MAANLQGLELIDSSSVQYNFEPYKEDNKSRGISIETRDWEIGDPEVYWRVPLYPFDGGLRQDRLPRSADLTRDFNRARSYSKANADASFEGVLVPPPALESLTFPTTDTVLKQVTFDSMQFFLCGRYIVTVSRDGTVATDKDFGSGKAAVDFAVFNNELIVAMGESEKIWKRTTGDVWSQASDNTFAIALGVVGNKLWRAHDVNQIDSCTTAPLTLASWTPADPNEYTAGDTTNSIHGIIEYGGVPVVLRPDGVFMPDISSNFFNQAPQIANWPHSDNGKGAFTAQGYLWVPTVVGLIRITYGESLIFGPEKSNRPDFRFWVRGGIEWGEAIYLLVTDELSTSETFICKMLRNEHGYSPDHPYIYHEWCRLGATTKGYTLGINTWPSPRAQTLTRDSGTQADLAGVGTITWSNPTNAASSNNSYATAAAGTSHYLRFSNFGFAIPTGATINGVTVGIERKTSTSTSSATSASGPGTISNNTSVGAIAWTLTTPTGSIVATLTNPNTSGSYLSNYLILKNWGFAIPTDATIVGISFTYYQLCTTAGGIMYDYIVKLVDGSGNLVGNNKAAGYIWPNSGSAASKTYGSSSDTWGASPTPSMVNDSDFGVALAIGTDNGADGSIRESYGTFSITITYTTSGTVDNIVKLVNAAASIVGDSKASASSWPTSDATATYGGEADGWNASLLDTDINDTDFGFVISVTTPSTITSSIDYAYISVTYTEATTSRAPSLFTGFGSNVRRIDLGFGSGRDIDDPTYSFHTSMEIETGLIQPAQDVTLVSGLLGVSIVLKIRSSDSFTLAYAKEGDTSYTSLLDTQEGGGAAAITDSTGLYQQFTRYAAANITSPYFKFKLSGTLQSGAGTDRPEIRSMWAYGYIRPKVTDLIHIPIYCDRMSLNNNGIPMGDTGGDLLRYFRKWKRDQEVLTMRFADYEIGRTIRVRVVNISGQEIITEKETDGISRETLVATVTLMRDDFAGAYANS